MFLLSHIAWKLHILQYYDCRKYTINPAEQFRRMATSPQRYFCLVGAVDLPLYLCLFAYVLSHVIRECEDMNGITIEGLDIKLSQYDITLLLINICTGWDQKEPNRIVYKD